MNAYPAFPIRSHSVSRWSCRIGGLIGAGVLLCTASAQTPVLDVSGGRLINATAPHQTYLSAMSNMTAEIWVNTTNSVNWRAVFSKYVNSQQSSGGEWYLALGDGGQTLHVQVVRSASSGAASHRTFNLPSRYDDGEWHHIAFTFEPSRIEAFYDGESVGVNTQVPGIRTNTVAVNIGTINNGNSPATDGLSFIGLVAEVRLWNIIRTPSEIQTHRHRRLKGDEPGLVAYWPLNEGDGTIINDRSAHQNHGTVNGASWELSDLPIRGAGTLIIVH